MKHPSRVERRVAGDVAEVACGAWRFGGGETADEAAATARGAFIDRSLPSVACGGEQAGLKHLPLLVPPAPSFLSLRL